MEKGKTIAYYLDYRIIKLLKEDAKKQDIATSKLLSNIIKKHYKLK